MPQTRVLIVDDQPLVRQGIRAVLSVHPAIHVVGEAADGAEAVRQVRALRPDVVLMDINMPRMNGLEATRRICEAEPEGAVKVVILTMFDDDDHVFAALRSGASGFLLKDAPTEKLVEAINEVRSGAALLSPGVTRRLIAEFARRPAFGGRVRRRLPDLTGREWDVLRLLIQGYGNQEIAQALVLGESTVKSHVQHLYQKLGVRDRVHVVIFAYENGLVHSATSETPPQVGETHPR
ncbi:response regulator [Streptomyces alkaliterrae]|uniref:Response regulator n=1 Tax=Streptomyces alkaliterrae TaxID=2213162 RepID=A0A5P0YMZ0_9ACTN|nr:response regulator transcription factor [Streptomyces alkaliterrae]MBB1253378.1 response regulator transcription factor [Streptomyces alkaliterrae]MBB1259172.1 response regulator transcription factor [Streptomyces alkaliterrae]MQS01598.1 response regulator [Streptomyces alkaliterrae]